MQLEHFILNLLALISVVQLSHTYPTDVEVSDHNFEEFKSTFYDISHDGGSRRHQHAITTNTNIDYYEYRHIFAAAVGRALDECRQKFKWDRWNCPKKAFLSILDREEFVTSNDVLPANKELGLTRALIASSTVLAMFKSCSYGTNRLCHCNSPFIWAGCEEIVRFGFKVARMYLDSQDDLNYEASKLINGHNFKAGRLAVRRLMKRKCRCHGVSGTCQLKTCWTVVPSMSEIGDYLKRQYYVAAKVGAMSIKETSADRLNKELSVISKDKLVFADVSPDYCYEHKQLGVNGTLNRYCSRKRLLPDGSEVSRSERASCDRLCTKCGYKVHKELLHYEKQCDCRFVYCCSIECQRCKEVEEAFKCVKHS